MRDARRARCATFCILWGVKMAPPNGLLPEHLWFPNKKRETIAFLQAQPAPSNVRRDWLLGWALWVGMRLNSADYRKVQDGAYDT